MKAHSGRPQKRVDALEVQGRAKPLECGAGGPQIALCGTRIALGGEGFGKVQTGACGLVRKIGRLPDPPRSTEQGRSLGGLVLAQEQLAPRRERPRLEQRPLVVRGDRVELVDGLTGRLEVAGGDRDVDLRRQEAAPRRPIGWPAIAGGSRQSPGDRALCRSTSPRASWRSASPGCAS